jgi:uroporphyrinogen decarboxylase
MTPRERWLAVLNKQTPDRVPTDYWGTGEVTERLLRDLACEDEIALWTKLGVDRKIAIGPRYVGPDRGRLGMWGLQRVTKSYGDGLGTYDEVVEHPLAGATTVEQINAYPHWPDPDDYDYSVLPAEATRLADWPLHDGG